MIKETGGSRGIPPCVKTVDDASFDTDVLAADMPVLVEFGAAWCPPCRMLAPILDEVAEERSSRLRVLTVDVDANPVTQGRYGVMSLPTLLLFVGGKPVCQVIGFTSKGRLLALVDEALEIAA
jgi:thioredoxin 1